MVNVAVIDDHPLMRRGVECVFASAGMAVECSVGSVAEFEAADVSPEVVVMDLYLGGGIPHVDSLRRIAESSRVLVMSASSMGQDVLAAIEAGADGYVTKQSSDETFVAAVAAVASGAFYLSSQLADIMQAESRRRASAGQDPKLSQREEEAIRLIAEGFTHAQAARRMGVSVSTFDTYVKRVRHKLRLGNKAELTRLALELEGKDAPGQDPV